MFVRLTLKIQKKKRHTLHHQWNRFTLCNFEQTSDVQKRIALFFYSFFSLFFLYFSASKNQFVTTESQNITLKYEWLLFEISAFVQSDS